jgi:L-ribulose-5-phosphate 3-epimerase
MSMRNRIGFMQGRLVDQIEGKIQAFPVEHWRDEFPAAQKLGLNWLEWTLDAQGLEDNPLCRAAGRKEIQQLSKLYALKVGTLTGDCFMQRPFWKANGNELTRRLWELDLVLEGAAVLGVRHVVIPLVDNGRLETLDQEALLIAELTARVGLLRSKGVGIAFESDFSPTKLARFIAKLPVDVFGINYDIGNSASLGFDPFLEFAEYGPRVCNVHMKDRILGGATVPLGTGDANFDAVFENLARHKYFGLVILQTARAQDEDHAGILARYLDLTQSLMERYLGS